MDFHGRKVLVAGMARSGICAARLLCELGAFVTVTDMKAELPEAREALADFPIRWRLGEDALGLARENDVTVISPGIPSDKGWVAEAIAGGIDVIGELELGFETAGGTVLAITGTNGKTTTTTLTAEIFKNAGYLSHAVGNIGDPITGVSGKTRAGDIIVAEVSSFQLETVKEFHPKVSAVLNISEDHLNRHGTMEEYIRLKVRIFENQGKNDYAVFNWDDSVTRAMGERCACTPVYFSVKERPPRGAWAEDGEIFFSMEKEGEARAICAANEVRIPGPHNLKNALASTAIALVMDVPRPVVRHTLRSFAGVEHRLEFVRELDGIRYINDSKGTNVDSTINAVRSMDRPTVLIAGGYDKKTDFASLTEEIAHSEIFRVMLIGQTAPQIEESLKKVGYEAVSHAHTLEEAVNSARALCVEGCNVLLSPACASFDMFKDFEERGQVFKAIVSDLT